MSSRRRSRVGSCQAILDTASDDERYRTKVYIVGAEDE